MEHLGLEVLYCVPPYSDASHTFGLPVNSIEDFKRTAKRIAVSDYQMNTHAIGDSANHVVLNTYKEILNNQIKSQMAC